MPSDLDLTPSQFDQNGFPIAIGFQPVEDIQAAGKPNLVDPAGPNGVGAGMGDADEALEPQEAALTGYELVADMLCRQDEVLIQLDDLNDRIELAIEQISAARKSEIEAFEALGQLLDDDDQAMAQQKAA